MVPHVIEWYDEYAGEEFEVLAIHYPEFGFEEQIENVQDALEKYGIKYPVALDNDGKTWRAYRQRYWPTRYLIDRNGNIRYKHIGEGAYDETARNIEALIAEPQN
ncbi:MAG: redoxin domain-containing protein [Candidatus Promineifilaceae bacterium]